MNATKRKFNALLNGIGNKSNASLTSKENASRTDITAHGDLDSQPKKRRISDSTSIPTSNQTLSLAKSALTTRLSSTIHHKKSQSCATAALSIETPKYAPWDRAEFLKRLKSFSNITDWTPKPARVNEVEWAKRGWVCRRAERVRCCLCNVEILVKLNRKEVDGKEERVYVAQNIEDALVDKYVELIVTSHNEDCLWRKRGCDDSIFKLPLNHAPTALQALRERYSQLCTRKDTLPYLFNIRTPPGFDIGAVLRNLPRDLFEPSPGSAADRDIDTSINKVAFIMAFFGWQGHTHERLGVQVGSVSCQACFRVLGLWLFKSKEINKHGEEVVGSAVSCLDVAEEHRDYCPWRNPTSQNGQKTTTNSTSLAGWQVLLRVIRNEHHLRTSGERDGLTKDQRQATHDGEGSHVGPEGDDDDATKLREENDKKRWARLRRVKSLFEVKGGRKEHKPDSQKSNPRT